ncbi:cupin domain-containing protein [Aspergillus foveolatus]|uniref:cupin domain-containing protein n=1 Tax=Aspergillus foveolatus TaxID=210207 RepID=UPI003CCD0729
MKSALEIETYTIAPTALVPNSPKPLLVYKHCFLRHGRVDLAHAYDTFAANHWDPKWVVRYGRQQTSHYHPTTHEVMVVLSGRGRIRWGEADFGDPANWRKHTFGEAHETGGVETEVEAGDIFLVPAGVAHKSFDTDSEQPDAVVLTGETAHAIDSDDPKEKVIELERQGKLTGFVMMGAYPRGVEWTWAVGGDHVGRFEEVWNLPTPEWDPVVGKGEGGIHRFWAQP